MLRSSVCRGQLHGRLRSRNEAVFEQRCANVLDERDVGRGRDVRVIRMRERRVYRSVHAQLDAMLEQRSPDLFEQRSVGCGSDVHEQGVRERRVHRRVHTRDENLQQPDATDVRLEWQLGERHPLRECL